MQKDEFDSEKYKTGVKLIIKGYHISDLTARLIHYLWSPTMKFLTLIFIIAFLSGCQATEAYETAKTVNTVSFLLAVERVCDPAASLAAERELSQNGVTALVMLCEETGHRP